MSYVQQFITSDLNYTGAQAIILAYFGPGTGQIFLDQVACSGDEFTLSECQSNPVAVHDCIHIEDAGVRCQGGGTQARTFYYLVQKFRVVAIL